MNSDETEERRWESLARQIAEAGTKHPVVHGLNRNPRLLLGGVQDFFMQSLLRLGDFFM